MEYLLGRDEDKENLLKYNETKLYILDFIIMVIGVLGTALAIYEYELYYPVFNTNCITEGLLNSNWKTCFRQEPDECFFFRIIITTSTVVLCLLIICRYVFYLKIEKLKGHLDYLDTLYTSGFYVSLIFEFLFLSIHVPPRLNVPFQLSQFEGNLVYTVNLFLCLAMFGRIYLIWRVYVEYSVWNSTYSRSICRNYGFDGGSGFAVRAELKERPYKIVAGVMLVSIFVFGITLRNLERPFEHYAPAGGSKLNWDYIWNGMWCVIITMSTVGYGDFYARTHLGRCISVIACFWGTFLISLMVLSLTISSEFSPQESKAFNKIKKDEAEEDIKEKAANAIKFAIKLKIFLRKFPNASEKKKAKWINKFKSALIEFKTISFMLRASEQDAPIEMVLSKLNEKVTFVLEKIKNDCYVYKGINSKLEVAENNQKNLNKIIDELLNLNQLVIGRMNN